MGKDCTISRWREGAVSEIRGNSWETAAIQLLPISPRDDTATAGSAALTSHNPPAQLLMSGGTRGNKAVSKLWVYWDR